MEAKKDTSTVINPRSSIQIITMNKDALKFQVPFAMSVSGPSQVRKNAFALFISFRIMRYLAAWASFSLLLASTFCLNLT